jgi:hypothetical protein
MKDARQTTRVINPYEFEPGTPHVIEDVRQTTISDFMGNDDAVPGTRAPHVKNSRSEDNAMYMTRKPIPLSDTQPKSNSHHAMYRSESSPRFTARGYPERRIRTPSPDVSAYYAEDESPSPTRRGRSQSRKAVGRGHLYENCDTMSTPSRQPPPDSYTTQDFCSPSHILSQSHNHRPPPNSFSPSRHMTRSPTRILGDVPEREECDTKISDADLLANPTLSTPKKRSRSPMKKMFGEHGWLGRSPDELEAVKLKSKKSSLGRKEKSSVMGKLRTKIGELVSTFTIIQISCTNYEDAGRESRFKSN